MHFELCRCGHARLSHLHYRTGLDCCYPLCRCAEYKERDRLGKGVRTLVRRIGIHSAHAKSVRKFYSGNY